MDRPVADLGVVSCVFVGGAQRQQHLPDLGVLQQDAADVAASAELRRVVVDVDEFHSDGGDVLLQRGRLKGENQIHSPVFFFTL